MNKLKLHKDNREIRDVKTELAQAPPAAMDKRVSLLVEELSKGADPKELSLSSEILPMALVGLGRFDEAIAVLGRQFGAEATNEAGSFVEDEDGETEEDDDIDEMELEPAIGSAGKK